jgi:hypothetical protein
VTALLLVEIARARMCAREPIDRASRECRSVAELLLTRPFRWSAIAEVYDSFTHVDAGSEVRISYWATSNYHSKKSATPSAEILPRDNRIRASAQLPDFSGVR